MNILFTGATSFTGMWFARALSQRGHQVTAIMRGSREGYTGLKAERLTALPREVNLKYDGPFGSEAFLRFIEEAGPIDVTCHHAADATNYKSSEFDILEALTRNALNLRRTLLALKAAGCRRLVLTGSVFEAGEGAGDAPLKAFSPYGMSKTLTCALFSYYTSEYDLGLNKFTIPNPFGPYEEPRFTDYLLRKWSSGEVAVVNTPAYVRDNIHVSLLAAEYVSCVEESCCAGLRKVNPSGYVETQGAFAIRFAREIGNRLNLITPVELRNQTEFPEPAVRINTMPCHQSALDWSEAAAWDDAADYYARRFCLTRRAL